MAPLHSNYQPLCLSPPSMCDFVFSQLHLFTLFMLALIYVVYFDQLACALGFVGELLLILALILVIAWQVTQK